MSNNHSYAGANGGITRQSKTNACLLFLLFFWDFAYSLYSKAYDDGIEFLK